MYDKESIFLSLFCWFVFCCSAQPIDVKKAYEIHTLSALAMIGYIQQRSRKD